MANSWDKNASMDTKNNTKELEQEIADLEARLHNAKARLGSSHSAPRNGKALNLSREPNGML